jgi:hypothetical protein
MLSIKHCATFAIFLLFGSTVLAIPQGPKRYRSCGSSEKQRERRIERGNYAASKLITNGVIRIYPEEWNHRVANNLCLCCGKAGHKIRDCPQVPKENNPGPSTEHKPGPSTEHKPGPSTEHNPSPATK